MARQTVINVIFDGMDISSVVNDYLLSVSFTDNEEDEADDLQIKLEDRDGHWLQNWLRDTIDAGTGGAQARTEAQYTAVTINDTHAGAYDTIARGSSSFDAAVCQIYLQALGYLQTGVVTVADGNTEAAISAFQTRAQLPVTGQCDPATWSALVGAINGMTIYAYTCTFTATGNVAMRSETNSRAKKVATIAKGKTCVVVDKPASGWYTVQFEGQTGYAKSSGLRLQSAELTVVQVPTGEIIGLSIRCGIIHYNAAGIPQGLDCGLFQLDSIKAGGPPSTVTIKGTSLGYNGIRKTQNDRSWENTTLSRIATDIALRAGLGVYFDISVDPYYSRVEQAKQTDIAFLKKLCQDAGYALKIANNTLVIYEQSKYEALEVAATFAWDDGKYIKWSLGTGEGQTKYDVCQVSYYDPFTGQLYTGTAYSEERQKKIDEGKAKDDDQIETLFINNQRVGSPAEAQALAEKMLKLYNKFERQVTLTVPGNPLLTAGMAVRLNYFGYWSGKYLINRAKHDVSGSGYVTTLTLRKVEEMSYIEAISTAQETGYAVGSVVTFNGGNQYKSSTATKASSTNRRAGPAKIVEIAALTDPHPYKLQGGKYNDLDGNSNVSQWVDAGTFT